jgi:hypothetical protein
VLRRIFGTMREEVRGGWRKSLKGASWTVPLNKWFSGQHIKGYETVGVGGIGGGGGTEEKCIQDFGREISIEETT